MTILYGQVSFDKIWQNNIKELIKNYSPVVVLMVLVGLEVSKK
jgi:hypothetical protein